ncbi:MAG: hypothetical protein J5716_08730 [Alphaproteobacteria bacterium]|nr:hypothetical protein [Alphaproteobacteria bacterium]
MKNIYTQESGRSMIEMLGVLAIIGVLSVGGIAGYSQAMAKYKVSKTTDQIQTMVTNIRTLFSSQKNYDGLTTGNTQLLYSAGILTDENCPDSSSCSAPMNPYGGMVLINYTKDDMSRSKRGFAVAYNGLPSDACVRLASQNWGDAASGLIAVEVKSSATTIANDKQVPAESLTSDGATVSYAKNANIPVSFETATKGCGTGGSASSLTLYYK